MSGNSARDPASEIDAEVDRLTSSVARARSRLAELRNAERIVKRSHFYRVRAAIAAARELFAPRERTGSADTGAFVISGRDLPEERSFASHDRNYARWRAAHVRTPLELARAGHAIGRFAARPTISIVMSTYDPKLDHLEAAIASVKRQIYPYWELCIADDASTDSRVRALLLDAAAKDRRIACAFRERNGNISEATNTALDLATGPFVGFLDHDDLLTPDALYEVANALDARPDLDMIYSDEDKIDEDGTLCEPHFKPDWCPDSLLSRNYTSHFSVFRRTLVDEVGRMRSRFDGSQDYDLTLRVAERTHRIAHLPAVLYHWRRHDESAAKRPERKRHAFEAARSAIAETIDRRGEPGTVTSVADVPGAYIVRYRIRERRRVTIVVPTRDHAAEVEACLRSIFANDGYGDFEVCIVDNGSTEPAALETFERWRSQESRVHVVRYDAPFNFSAINNYAVDRTRGHYLLFLNNDTEVISPDWLEAMVEQAQRPTIGAVGAHLLYPDETIQHAGVVVGIGGVAGHSHKYVRADSDGYFMMLDSINNYSAVTGACLMVRRAVFEEAGRFDESLRVAFNDVDLCLKIGALGYRNVVLPHVRLYHHESRSRGLETTPERQMRFAREIATMQTRWRTNSVPDPCYSPNLTLVTEDYAIGV